MKTFLSYATISNIFAQTVICKNNILMSLWKFNFALNTRNIKILNFVNNRLKQLSLQTIYRL